MKRLLTVQDLTKEEILSLFESAKQLKDHLKRNKRFKLLEGKTLAMLFEKPSTRTRASFEVAMDHLGGHASFLSAQDLQLGRGETIADSARVLGRYYDAIMARVYEHKTLEILAEYSGIPVINGLSDKFHPCQALTDIFTIWERGLDLSKIALVFVGDGNNNVATSLGLICERLEIQFRVASPPDSPSSAVNNADIVYTDTWVSMGMEKEERKRLKALAPYQLNCELLSHAKKDALVMHCLPAHRGREITDEVIDGPNSIVFDQAENRLHVQKAILTMLMR